MSKSYSTDKLRQLLDSSRTVLVSLPMNPRLDVLAAGLAVHRGLQKTQKQTTIFSPSAITAEHNRLIGVNEIKQNIANRSLVISWPHQSYQVERAYTEIDSQQDRFQIIIEPQEEGALMDHRQISYDYTGVSADMIIFVGTRFPDDLAHLRTTIEGLISSVHVVRVDTKTHDPHPEAVDFFDNQASSVSEMAYHLLNSLDIPLDEDIATNILAGIEHQTSSLSDPGVGPETLETVAACMRLGGKRGYVSITEQQTRLVEPDVSPEPIRAQSAVISPVLTEVDQPENRQMEEVQETASPAGSKIPSWLKPKIFRPTT